MGKEYKIMVSDYIEKRLSDLSVATGLSEEELIKIATFNHILQF